MQCLPFEVLFPGAFSRNLETNGVFNIQWAAPEATRAFLWRASRGQYAFLRGLKSKILPTMANFDDFL